jgi:hypothetical protein
LNASCALIFVSAAAGSAATIVSLAKAAATMSPALLPVVQLAKL